MKVTLRQCIHLTNAAEQLKGMGGFKFRCALAGITMEATKRIEQFNEAQKPAKGMQAFQEEIALHRENCTKEKDGKKTVNVAELIPLIEKARSTHAKAIEKDEKVREEAQKSLDNEIELQASPIPMEMLEQVDSEEKFEISMLSRILPFAK
jgi:hypothetical protein